MLNDNRDKELQRNQLIAIVLMTVLVISWTYFFLPTEPPQQPPETAANEAVDIGDKEYPSTSEQAPPFIAPKGEAIPDGKVVLPPVATASDDLLEDDMLRLANNKLELAFTRVGARLKEATVLLGKEGVDSIQLVPQTPILSDAEAVYPFALLFSDPVLGDALNYRRWEVLETPNPQSVAFQIEVPGYVRLVKTFTLEADAHVAAVRVVYTNLSDKPRLLGLDRKEPAFSLYWGPNVASGDLKKGAGQSIVLRKDGKNTYENTAKLSPPKDGSWYNERILDPEWAAISSAYFTVALKPEFESADAWFHGAKEMFRVGIGAPRAELAPGDTMTCDYLAYMGPRGQKALRAAWPSLETALAFFTTFTIMDSFSKLLLAILVWFHDNVIANYGLAIIFLTLIVRTVMFPLTWKSMLSMKKMSKLAPEMEKLKAECGDDQQELQKRMMEMYRERGVSPLGGCLPMLLQMPVFIALYRMLWSAFELRRAPFILWIQDLSEPDRLLMLPFKIPIPFSDLPLESLNLLPILMAAAMVVSQKLMPMSGPAQNKQQKMLMTFMPVFFAVITYNMASGLNLYILVSTLLGIAQNRIIQGIDVDVEPVKRKKPAKPRHFYDVARSRQREMNKEIRKQKQRSRKRKDPKDKK